MTLITYPPGPRSNLFRLIQAVISGEKFEPLEFAHQMNETYGPMGYVKFGLISFYQIADPDIVHEILVEQADKFHKAKIMKDVFRPFTGNGLLTSDGSFWKRQRKLAQPAFHARHIENYGQVMVDYTLRMLLGWRDGETRFFDREMMKLTLGIVSKTLFDADVSKDADRVGDLMTELLEASNERLLAAVRLPDWITTPHRAKVNQKIAELDAIIQRFINERRASGDDRVDLLSMLLMAVDDTDNSQMTDRQLRDEAMTLFIAGHETTAMALSWTAYLLAQHPEAMAKLRAEVDSVLGGRAATVSDLAALPYTEMVVKEALRLYPPASSVSREPIEDVEIGGYTLPKGATIQISFYQMHHNPKYFANPEAFDPERFSLENEAKIPRYAYLPFGGGPRVCIGNQFAMMEARLILATIMQHYDFALAPGQTVTSEVLLTIRPKGGLQMTLKQREAVKIAV